ncbi:MAG: hypothetical protein WA364_09340 [Candidatus Nitrosopolaris sp.]
MKSAFASMELLLSRIDNGLRLRDEMYMMIASLSHSTGVLCDNCKKELYDKSQNLTTKGRINFKYNLFDNIWNIIQFGDQHHHQRSYHWLY